MKHENRIHHSFKFAANGIIQAFHDNRNLKIHIAVGILVLTLSFVLGLTKFEKIIIMLMVTLVISAEMINTSIEEMIDLITSEHRQEAERAKDVAAGTVLVISLFAAAVGIVIFYPYILRLI